MGIIVKPFILPENWESMLSASEDAIAKVHTQINEDLYGPKYCKHCDKIQKMIVYQKDGTFKFETERKADGSVVGTASFLGSRICSICLKEHEENQT